MITVHISWHLPGTLEVCFETTDRLNLTLKGILPVALEFWSNNAWRCDKDLVSLVHGTPVVYPHLQVYEGSHLQY